MSSKYNGTVRSDVANLSKSKTYKQNLEVKDSSTISDEYTARANLLAPRLRSLESYLSSSIYAVFINLRIGSVKMSISSNDNLLVSINHKKNGTGAANAFTIQIAYKPTNSSISGEGSINYIDYILFNSDYSCGFQYGYGDNYLSPQYEGMITKYTEEIQEGFLYYTITGYSSIVSISEDTVDVVPLVKSKRATEIAYDILSEKLKGTGYTVAIDKDAKDTDSEIDVTSCPDTHLFQYVRTILSRAYNKENDNREESTQITYSFVVDDNSKTIVIIKQDPLKKSSELSIVFEWMTRNNSLVQNFTADYNGYIVMAYKNTSDSNKDKETLGVGVDSAGNPVKKSSVKSSTPTGDASNNDYAQEKSKWSEAIAKASYGATLTLTGIPFEIPITTVIKVVPLINGVEHLTSGYYRVLSSEDNIDLNGFTTVLDLTKIPESGDQ